MQTFRVTMADGESFFLSADMTRLTAPIWAKLQEDGAWQRTPYQTADAISPLIGLSSERAAAKLVAHHFLDRRDVNDVVPVEDEERPAV